MDKSKKSDKTPIVAVSFDSSESSSEDYESSDAAESRSLKKLDTLKDHTTSSSSEDSNDEIWNKPTNQLKQPTISLVAVGDGENTGVSCTAAEVKLKDGETGLSAAAEFDAKDLPTSSLLTNLSQSVSDSSPGDTKKVNQSEKDVKSISESRVAEDSSLKNQSTIGEESIKYESLMKTDMIDNTEITAQGDSKIISSDGSLPLKDEPINVSTSSQGTEKQEMDKFIENILHKFSTPEQDIHQQTRNEPFAEVMSTGYRIRSSSDRSNGVLSTVVGSVVQNQSKVVRQLKTLATDMDQVQDELRQMMKDLESKQIRTYKSNSGADAHSKSYINRNEWLFEIDDKVALDDSDVRTYYQFVRSHSPLRILKGKYSKEDVDDDELYSWTKGNDHKSLVGFQRNVTFDLGEENREPARRDEWASSKYDENDYSSPRLTDDYWLKSKNDKRGYCYMCGEFECNPYSHAAADHSQVMKDQASSASNRYSQSSELDRLYKRDEPYKTKSKEFKYEFKDVGTTRAKEVYPKTRSKFLKKIQHKAMVGEKVTPSEGFQSRFLKCELTTD